MDIITLIIAILGFIVGTLSWIHYLITGRVKLEYKIKGYMKYDNEDITLYLNFVNKSSFPISITSISIVLNDGTLISCIDVPETCFSDELRQRKITKEIIHPPMLPPINVPSLAGKQGYVQFSADQDIIASNATHVTLQVSTNRRKTFESSLELRKLVQ